MFNQCSWSAVGSLFANYRSPYSYAYGSLFNFKIRNNYLAFTETSGLSLSSTGTVTISEWTHVALVVEYDTATSGSFYRNGATFGSYTGIAALMLDNCSFNHYIGGIRHNMRLYDAFRGFIYEFNVSQTAKTDFTDNHTDTCTG